MALATTRNVNFLLSVSFDNFNCKNVMADQNIIFLTGLHRSGTSLLHEIIRSHPQISGFYGTGVPEDEGQHLQSIFKPAKCFGGPGKFAFDTEAYMDESHPLATHENAKKLLEEWGEYFDLSSRYLIEKSPPTLIRTRFFQKLFPQCKFIVILRHPLAIAYATRKWSKTSISSLLDHTLLAYDLFFKDMHVLTSVYVLKYEDFVSDPQHQLNLIFSWLGLSAIELRHKIHSDVNQKYFEQWQKERSSCFGRIFKTPVHLRKFENHMKKFGYSMLVDKSMPIPSLHTT